MLKYDLVSDLHLEHKHEDRKIEFKNDLVIVAGDTTNGLGGVKWLNKQKKNIFAVDGNHEHYVRDGFTLTERTRQFYDGRNQAQVMFLDNYKLGIIGANGWYEIKDPEHWQGYMTDARYVRAAEVNEQAIIDAAFIQGWLEKFDEAIVVTHTAPCEATLDPKYAGSDGNPYFWNPWLEAVMMKHSRKILRWHHGHTHHGMDEVVHGVRVITNPRGYPGENLGWKPLSIEVEV